ncbi:MAG: hypothetical protein M3Q48_10405 [Actinomycetota bacterium]|nr:hypothetical protein [Actinomycetota bacterium]
MRKVRYAVLFGAVLASGTYLFVYLYRWEWHRALVAGVVLVAAEVGLAAAAILDRLRAIERRLDAPAGNAAPADGALTLARIREVAPPPRADFEWLTRQAGGGQLSVFVPILLGAGVVLSGLAWVVERVARATARPTLERGLARRLLPLSMPEGVFRTAAAVVAPRRRSLALPAVAALVGVAVTAVGIDAMADATQDRPDVVRPGTASSVIVAISARPARSTLTAVDALWGACTTQLGRGHTVLSMTDLGGGNVNVVVGPAIGTYAERRLRGCIGDATTDKVQASVLGITELAGAPS